MRSLRRDSFRASLAGLIIATLLLLAWTTWFFLSKVPVYETSSEFQIRRDGLLAVAFPPEAQARIQPGQGAELRLAETGGGSPQTLPAIVMETPTTGGTPNQVLLYVNSPELLKPGQVGEVRVVVERVSPARLVLRSAGKFVGRPMSSARLPQRSA